MKKEEQENELTKMKEKEVKEKKRTKKGWKRNKKKKGGKGGKRKRKEKDEGEGSEGEKAKNTSKKVFYFTCRWEKRGIPWHVPGPPDSNSRIQTTHFSTSSKQIIEDSAA